MSKLHLEIVSPEKLVFDGDADSVSLPGVAGRFTILPRHAPIIASLAEGDLKYATGNKEETISIKRGFVEVSDNDVSVCVEIS